MCPKKVKLHADISQFKQTCFKCQMQELLSNVFTFIERSHNTHITF